MQEQELVPAPAYLPPAPKPVSQKVDSCPESTFSSILR